MALTVAFKVREEEKAAFIKFANDVGLGYSELVRRCVHFAMQQAYQPVPTQGVSTGETAQADAQGTTSDISVSSDISSDLLADTATDATPSAD